MIEQIGWVASFFFAICALPQALLAYKQGHARDVSLSFLILWLMGEILMQVYVISKHGFDKPLLFNYWINTLFIIIILKYKIKERT